MKNQLDNAAVAKAFAALETYDWGAKPKLVEPITEAIVAIQDDADARKDLEVRLAAVLKTDAPRDAKDFVCRRLMVIGTAESVPALAALLSDEKLSHMGRYALERMPAPEAAQALRDALSKLSGSLQIGVIGSLDLRSHMEGKSSSLQIGVIGSLGARRDLQSGEALTALLADKDTAVACAAAQALGALGTPASAKALGATAKASTGALKLAATNGCLKSAELLLADGKKVQAMAAYKSLSGTGLPKHIRLAVTRGLLSVAGKKN